MATKQQAMINGLSKSTLPAETPTKGLLRVKPFATKVFGNFMLSGFFRKDKVLAGDKSLRKDTAEYDNHPWNYIGRILLVPGLGFILNMENEHDRNIYEILTQSDEAKGFFVCPQPGTRGPEQRFYIEDLQTDAESYLKNRDRKVEVDAKIHSLKGQDLKKFGLLFNIEGSEQVVKTGLYRMAENPSTMKNLAAVILNADLPILGMIAVAEKLGSREKKTGFYKNSNGVYMYNEKTISATKEGVVAFLKEKANDGFYAEFKKMYETATID